MHEEQVPERVRSIPNVARGLQLVHRVVQFRGQPAVDLQASSLPISDYLEERYQRLIRTPNRHLAKATTLRRGLCLFALARQ